MDSIAIGRKANANGQGIATGLEAQSNGSQAIAIGKQANADGGAAIAIGCQAYAGGTDSGALADRSDVIAQ